MFELNYFKVQMDIIKDYERSLFNKKYFSWKFAEYQNCIFCFNNTVGYGIPKNIFVLNEEVTGGRFISNSLLTGTDYDSIRITNDYTDIEKLHCRVFTNDSETVCVDTKLLKHFILQECTFQYVKGGLIRILVNDILVGIVCPIKKGGN